VTNNPARKSGEIKPAGGWHSGRANKRKEKTTDTAGQRAVSWKKAAAS
jgi:hypothetical protein